MSEKLLRIARTYDQLELAGMDMRLLGFRPRVFDGVWACASLLHIPREVVAGVLSELRQILTSNGLLFIAVKEGTTEGFVETQPGFIRFFSFHRPGRLEEMLSKEEFEVVRSYQDRKEGTMWSNIFARSLQ